jgi:hypothetical protein
MEEAQAELATSDGVRRRSRARRTNICSRALTPTPKCLSQHERAMSGIVMSAYVFALMLLVVVCGNVALLLFARAATRESVTPSSGAP